MINSKPIAYLKTLTSSEMKDFGLFISIAKGAKDAILLHTYLAKYHPNYPAKKIDKSIIATKLFPTEKNKDRKLINAMHRYVQLLDVFFIQEELKDNAEEKNFLLLQAFKKRKLDKYFFKKADQIEKDWQNEELAGLEHLYYAFRLKRMYFRHPKYTLQNKQPVDILNVIKNIDQYYVAIKLYWHLILHNNRSYLSEIELIREDEILINAIQEVCLDGYFDEVPQIKFFAELLNAFNKNDFSSYVTLKDNFIKYFGLYNEKERNMITIFLLSACYQNHQLGKQEALMQLFELNCFMLENNLIIYDGYIQFDQFWNIVTIGLAAKQNLWIEDFIKKFGAYLPDNEKDDVLAVCKAMVSFHKKNYTEALRILSTIKFQNTLYGLYARNIQLKCYYELDNEYEEMFWGFTKSFNMFLFRNKNISNTMKEDFKNYITFSKTLYKMKSKAQICDPIYMKKKLEESTNIASKTWLIEKINEISVS